MCWHLSANAQYVLINLIGEDCVKCRKGVEANLKSLDFIPYYFLFDEGFQGDSSAIRAKYLQSNDLVVFDNALLRQKKKRASSILYINKDGDNVYEKTIAEFSSNDVDAIKSLYFSDTIINTNRPKFNYLEDGWIIRSNSLLHTFVADSGKYQISLSITEKMVQDMKKIFKSDPNYEHSQEMQLKYPSINFTPSVLSFAFSKGNAYYLVGLPYIKMPTIAHIANGAFDGAQDKRLFVYKVNKDNKPQLITLVSSDTLSPISQSFKVVDNKMFFLFINSQKNIDSVTYLAELDILGSTTSKIKILGNKYDRKLYDRNIGMKYFPDFRTFSYPFFLTLFSNKVANVVTETDHYFSASFDSLYDKVDMESLLSAESGGASAAITNYYFIGGDNSKAKYLIHVIGSSRYFTYFKVNENKLDELYTVRLADRGLKMSHKYGYVTLSVNKENLIYEDDKGYLRSVKLSVLAP